MTGQCEFNFWLPTNGYLILSKLGLIRSYLHEFVTPQNIRFILDENRLRDLEHVMKVLVCTGVLGVIICKAL